MSIKEKWERGANSEILTEGWEDKRTSMGKYKLFLEVHVEEYLLFRDPCKEKIQTVGHCGAIKSDHFHVFWADKSELD